MALTSQRALLDELMGKDRNLDPLAKHRVQHWSDGEICKWHLAGLCPHDLFTNTRVDIGPCDSVHDERALDEYRSSGRYGKLGYEDALYRHLKGMLEDVERKIRKGHARLEINSDVSTPVTIGQVVNKEKIEELTLKITAMLERMEKLGNEGRVEEAQAVMVECETAKTERAKLEAFSDPSLIPAVSITRTVSI